MPFGLERGGSELSSPEIRGSCKTPSKRESSSCSIPKQQASQGSERQGGKRPYIGNGTNKPQHFHIAGEPKLSEKAPYSGASSVSSESFWLAERSSLRNTRTCTSLTGISTAVVF